MKSGTWAVVALMVMGGGAVGLSAQRPAGPGQGTRTGMAARGPVVGMDVRIGQALDRRYELDLDDEQVRRLEELRSEARDALDPARRELAALREAVRDGSLPRPEAREGARVAMQSLREAQVELRGRFDELLRPEQRMRLGRAVGPRARGGAWRDREGRRRPPALDRWRAPGRRGPALRGPGGREPARRSPIR